MIDYGITVPNNLECFDNTLFVEELEHGEKQTKWGFIIPEEKMDYEGNFIHPRWAKVLSKANNIKDFEVGDWVLMKHGHWSTSLNLIINGEQVKLWYITPKNRKVGMLAISKTMPPQLTKYIDSINS